MELIEYKVTYLQGTTGNTEWWTGEDWAAHEIHVEKLKELGQYLKPTTVTMSLMHNPLFDDIRKPQPEETYEIVILDFSKD